ncbi:hypothetical protein JTB14_010787 [Gonioctena quinquepunctata]|nr:hypothetical protein JTB14_010787 [Gonioctena quinquepunctata]
MVNAYLIHRRIHEAGGAQKIATPELPKFRYLCFYQQKLARRPVGRPSSAVTSPATAVPRVVPPPKWLVEKAQWSVFEEHLELPGESDDIYQEVENLTACTKLAAKKAIPMRTQLPIRRVVPWWNPQVRDAIQKKKRAFNRFRRYNSLENLILFKKARAEGRRIIVQNKRTSWNIYVSSISSHTPISEVWRKVKAIAGNGFSQPFKYSRMETGDISDSPSTIAECLVRQFCTTSSNNNYEQEFLRLKAQHELPLDFGTPEYLHYNSPFTLAEFDYALSCTEPSAPGPDSLNYEILKHLSYEFKISLLISFNKIWNSHTYPPQWKEAITVAMLKGGKDPQLPFSYRPISLTCCMDLTALPKNETTPVIYRQLFLEIIREFPQSTILYTDGSKTATGVGCVLSVENEIHTWSLSSCASIYTTELYAIWQALLFSSMTRDKQKIIIVCDSRSVLQSISNSSSEDPLVLMIRLSIHDLHNNGRNVPFIWAPSHIGIVGNEIADIAARNAAEAEGVEARILRMDDVKIEYNSRIKADWQREEKKYPYIVYSSSKFE